MSWRALTPEIVQPRRLPDGMIEATLAGQAEPARFIVEIQTYLQRRAEEQAWRAAFLAALDAGTLPEVITLVLRPKGVYQVPGAVAMTSAVGGTTIRFSWRVVNLWTVAAAELLATGDVGILPWVPLADSAEPPENVLQFCRERIDRFALPAERENLLAVTQVLASLRYDDEWLLRFLGGTTAMIDSPVLKRFVAKYAHEMIEAVLSARFGPSAATVSEDVRRIDDAPRFNAVAVLASNCQDLDTFRRELAALPPPPVEDDD